ncbi:MAG: signal recognition particle-docking protein FtsY [Candidatus Micrarchaeota archaeon]
MFDFLKKKINDFVGVITRKEEKVAEQAAEGKAEAKIEELKAKPFKVEEQIASIPEIAPDKEIITPVMEKELIAEEKEQEKIEPIHVPEPKHFEEPKIEPKPLELHVVEPKIAHIEPVDERKEKKLIEEVAKVKPHTPNQIVNEGRKIEEKAMIKEVIREEMHKELEEEKEIEELVGETIEERVRQQAIVAERKIVEEKKKEEIAKEVFTARKEDFLASGKERDLKTKVGIFSQIKSLFGADVQIGEGETKELFDQFEMALLESDVSYLTAQAMIADLKRRLIGKRVKAGKIQEEVRREIAFALASILQSSKSDFFEKVENAKKKGEIPFIVLFLGPNGMGKTTTIAKVAYNLKERGCTSVISASDTFRAAAIEQASHHGEKLGIKVVKHKYGADPAAVAYDAIAHAKAHKLDVVLIDTAGRQDTNLNLLTEMQKIVRVVKPNMKIFIAEAIAGSSLVNQVKVFNEKLGVDGIILTKLDCDAKGGGSLSIAYECKLPVYFVGTGQEYTDLLEFNESWIIKNIMAE